MKHAIFTALYALGLSAFIPFLLIHNRSSAALPMFFAPILAAVLAEFLGRSMRLSNDAAGNRVIWLIAAFILISQTAKFALGLDALGFTQYMALNALYQIFLALLFSALSKREPSRSELGHRHFFHFGPEGRTEIR